MSIKNICEYGCGQEARYQFKNGKWCCKKNFYKCPAQNRKILENFNRGRKLRNELLELKKVELMVNIDVEKCRYCGQEAKFFLRYDNKKNAIFCCRESSRKCPEFGQYLSQNHKMKTGTQEEILIYRNKLKESQNRKYVRKAKQKKMTNLHNSTEKHCVDFQKKFREAHRRRRGLALKISDRF